MIILHRFSSYLYTGELTKLERSTIGALITIDVHARDMITEMVIVQVDDISSFEWQKQLRYYTHNVCLANRTNLPVLQVNQIRNAKFSLA